MITSAGTVKSSSGATVRLRQNIDCTTENVVYQISCSSCNTQYVGETKGPLNKRMNGHRDDWRHRRFERSPTAEQFHSADRDFLSHASVCYLEHNKEWSDSTRKLRESYWIRRLNTLCPFGINKGDCLSGHMVGHLVCCVVVNDTPGAYTCFRLLFYTTFLKRHFLPKRQFCALCLIHKYFYSHIFENPSVFTGPFKGLNHHIIHVYSYILLSIHLILFVLKI